MIFVEVVKNDMCQPMIGLHQLYMGPSLVLGYSNRLTCKLWQSVCPYSFWKNLGLGFFTMICLVLPFL